MPKIFIDTNILVYCLDQFELEMEGHGGLSRIAHNPSIQELPGETGRETVMKGAANKMRGGGVQQAAPQPGRWGKENICGVKDFCLQRC